MIFGALATAALAATASASMRFGLVVQILFVGVLGRINMVLRNGLDSGLWNLVQYIQGCVLSFLLAYASPVSSNVSLPIFAFSAFLFYFYLDILNATLYII